MWGELRDRGTSCRFKRKLVSGGHKDETHRKGSSGRMRTYARFENRDVLYGHGRFVTMRNGLSNHTPVAVKQLDFSSPHKCASSVGSFMKCFYFKSSLPFHSTLTYQEIVLSVASYVELCGAMWNYLNTQNTSLGPLKCVLRVCKWLP